MVTVAARVTCALALLLAACGGTNGDPLGAQEHPLGGAGPDSGADASPATSNDAASPLGDDASSPGHDAGGDGAGLVDAGADGSGLVDAGKDDASDAGEWVGFDASQPFQGPVWYCYVGSAPAARYIFVTSPFCGYDAGMNLPYAACSAAGEAATCPTTDTPPCGVNLSTTFACWGSAGDGDFFGGVVGYPADDGGGCPRGGTATDDNICTVPCGTPGANCP